MPPFNEFAKYSCNLRAAAGGDGTGNAGEPAAVGEQGGHIPHIIHVEHGPSRVQSQGQDGGAFLNFSDRVFTGLGFAASVRAEQHNSRLWRDTGPCNSISFDQFFSGAGNTPGSVSACFMEGCKCLPWLIHKAQMGSWKTDILLSP